MAQQHARVPFSSFAPTQSQITCSGPMSYNPGMHGSTQSFSSATPFPALADLSTLPPDPTYYDISVATHKQIASLQAKLDQKLGPEYISQRPGPGGGQKLTYAEGWKIINLANEVFGFNGWSSSICSLNVDYIDVHDEGRRWNCGVSAVVRVTLRDGVYHEDVGYGTIENAKNKGAALDKCKKEAVTDAIKRTLRNFGNLLGNCLYDKQYTQEIVKIKVQPPKFDRSSLHRRPEFEEGVRGSNAGSKIVTNIDTSVPAVKSSNMAPPPPQQAGKMNPPIHVKPEPGSAHIPAQQPNLHPASHAQLPGQRTAPDSVLRSGSTSVSSSVTAQPRKVPSPVNEPSVDLDEASYFNSEDDALFMQLDIGEAGGIVLEEDRPIEYEDTSTEDNSGAGVNQPHPHLLEERSAHHQSSGPSTATHPSPVTNSNRNNAVGQARPQNQHRQQSRPLQPSSNAGQEKLHQRPAQPQPHTGQQRPQQRPPQHKSQAGQRPPQQHGPQQQRLPQDQQPSGPIQTPNATASRPATPSMGGFHFPPGIDTSSRLLNRPSAPSSSGGAQVAGIKRGADAMNSHGNHGHIPSNMSGQQRAPFAPLEVGEGGDVKRTRR